MIRVGHRGAPAVSEDNTLASFDAALGVTGVITNDPRLFAAIEQTDAL